MKLDELKSMATEDLKLDDAELGKEATDTPALHNKYLKIFHDEFMELKKREHKVKRLYRELHEYYSGKADPDMYKRKGAFDQKVLKGDIPTYIEADDEYQRAVFRRDMQKAKVEYLQGVLKSINQRQWHIRNAIEWNKFTNGIT